MKALNVIEIIEFFVVQLSKSMSSYLRSKLAIFTIFEFTGIFDVDRNDQRPKT